MTACISWDIHCDCRQRSLSSGRHRTRIRPVDSVYRRTRLLRTVFSTIPSSWTATYPIQDFNGIAGSIEAKLQLLGVSCEGLLWHRAATTRIRALVMQTSQNWSYSKIHKGIAPTACITALSEECFTKKHRNWRLETQRVLFWDIESNILNKKETQSARCSFNY